MCKRPRRASWTPTVCKTMAPFLGLCLEVLGHWCSLQDKLRKSIEQHQLGFCMSSCSCSKLRCSEFVLFLAPGQHKPAACRSSKPCCLAQFPIAHCDTVTNPASALCQEPSRHFCFLLLQSENNRLRLLQVFYIMSLYIAFWYIIEYCIMLYCITCYCSTLYSHRQAHEHPTHRCRLRLRRALDIAFEVRAH